MRAQHVYIFLERIKQDVFVSLPPIISHCCLCVCIILYLCRDEDYRSEADVSNGTFIGYKPHIEELEMLLEAYFVQIDGTLNKLSHLREYVDDTEDYINIMLDDKQNQLLQMGVMLSTATVVITAGVAVVGLFGMNIGISLYADPTNEEEKRASNMKFWETTLGTIAGCTVMYIVAMGWGKRSGLLQ
jgi:Mg2+ and Co2+ transporter CorA